MKSNRFRGFSLVEVLVALSIFATATMAVMNATNIHSLTIPVVQEKVIANLVLHNQVVEVLTSGAYPPLGEKSGKSEQMGMDWYWKIKVVKTENEQYNLRAVTVQVSNVSDFTSILSEKELYVTDPN